MYLALLEMAALDLLQAAVVVERFPVMAHQLLELVAQALLVHVLEEDPQIAVLHLAVEELAF
jgi:hypothetical protein